ncbi:MAG TPA: LuxR family transcriptional regulator [Verrucomicrobiae bacterium]|nr:LuxR family transcriptional regulator [Verrucomicrobiae bacterium]
MAGAKSSAATSLIVRQAFDAVAAVQKVKDLETLNSTVERTFARLGFDIFAGFTHVAPGGVPNVSVLFGGNHQAWEARYVEAGHQNNDAVIPVALARSDPFYWSEVPTLTPLTNEGQRIFNEATEFKLKDGLVVPMHGLDGSISSVLLAGAHVETKDLALRSASHMLALYFGSVGRRLVGQLERNTFNPVHLTPRQVECLRWVRAGKSSSDIGDILSLSPRTIDTYLLDACARLGVRTRVQAVAEAAIRGIIDL